MKAKDPHPKKSLVVAESLGAEHRGQLLQRDTYFHVSSGRLKLREETGAVPRLISYERADQASQRESRYRIIEIEQADELRAALESTLGVKISIVKRRRLFVWGQVRIHLDEVNGLGSFIELEAVASASSDLSSEGRKLRSLRKAFDIADEDLIGESYCDLAMLNAR